MGLIEDLIGSSLFLDSSPLIYYIEEHPRHIQTLNKLFKASKKSDIHFHTSVLTLLEVLVHPLRLKKYELAQKY